jgi:TrmH family RNA methyltransferase
VREITSRKNALVAEYRALARRRAPGATPALLEGAHLAEEAIAAGVSVRRAAVTRDALRQSPVKVVVDRLHKAGADVVAVTAAVMRAMSPAPSPSGLIAIADLPPADLDRAFLRSPQLVFILFDVQDPGNAGAVVRSAEALGATAVIFCGASADPFGWKALRGSMGSAFRLPVLEQRDGLAAIAAARAAGLAILATAPGAGRTVFDADLTLPTALLLGGEGAGLESAIVAAADSTISIPMTSPVESLNVSVAAALLAWEARSQRARRSQGTGDE